ncbi:hypothetical protein BVX98_07265 [bacterium F11]|nr:hypothetical protein BVX98_07265 [bacterium F11]
MRHAIEKPSPILCLNSGSSSLKFSLYLVGSETEKLLATGTVERIGSKNSSLQISDPKGKRSLAKSLRCPNHKSAVRIAFEAITNLSLPQPVAIGHRIVHGGPKYSSPELVTPSLLKTLNKLVSLAPLHLPSGLLGIDSVKGRFPKLPQVACFDTAFHRHMPQVSQKLPLPRRLWDHHLRRYGFHGLSYEYVVSKLGKRLKGRSIIAHLGNGASMVALLNGKPIDTTMGLTPAGGFMMGTRSGDIDPGILTYLLKQKRFSVDGIDRLINYESGLRGVSNKTHDMKTLLDRRAKDSKADFAIKMFCHHVRKTIGALSAVLGGLDSLIFTGGIGERAIAIRKEICEKLGYLGVRLDPKKNKVHAEMISSTKSQCRVFIIPTKEDLVITRHTYNVLQKQ